ncbi:MAG: glycerate kinase [Chloroflexi bacterium]|nr:glycerate kinase [Chloroflexota bacterium]
MKIKKILLSPQEFKESLSGIEVAMAMKKGIRNVDKNVTIDLCPVADGGDGTLQTLVDITEGELIKQKVHNPLGKIIDSEWGKLGDNKTAVIEMAKASGLALLNENEKDPMKTSTYGTGELFKSALDHGIRDFIIGIGGSATNDGGAGFASALGAKLLDSNKDVVIPTGESVGKISHIDTSGLDKRLKEVKVMVACDVNNPLCGKNGASNIFGPQKGANEQKIKILDKSLRHWAKVIKDQMNKDILNVPGSGAAGGLGAGLMAFTDAELSSGADIVLDYLNYEKKLEGVDLVIVGEGQTDKSTQFNKSPIAVSLRAKKYNIPVIVISGSLGKGYNELENMGIDAFFSIVNGPMDLQYAINNAFKLIETTTQEIYKSISL